MADSSSYPQLPNTVWRGVWKILHDAPSRRLDDNTLAVELGVQRTAAKQYRNELARLGLFSDDGSPTELANLWRQDGTHREVLEQILDHAYPEELRQLAPIENLDREKITRWFMSQGLGNGAAKNKAATYIRVASGVSYDAEAKPNNSPPPTPSKAKSARRIAEKPKDVASREDGHKANDSRNQPQLAVNLQIHISAEASNDQINAIFAAMRTYFDGDRTA